MFADTRAPASSVFSRIGRNTRYKQAALGHERRRKFPSDPTTETRGRPRRARFDPVRSRCVTVYHNPDDLYYNTAGAAAAVRALVTLRNALRELRRELPRAHTHNTPSTRDRVSADTAADPYPHPRNGFPLPANPRLHRVPDWSPTVSRVLGRSRSRCQQPPPSNGARGGSPTPSPEG